MLRRELRTIYRPRSKAPAREWNEEHLSLRPTESPERHGPYRGGDHVAITRLLDTFFNDPAWRYCDIEKCAQSGLTFHTLAYIVRRCDEAPVNVLYAIDSATKAARVSRRLQHLLQDCRLTAGRFERARRHDEVTAGEIRWPGANLFFVGAGSAGQLASEAVGLAIGDEVDKHPEIDGEAPTIDLLDDRIKTIIGGKRIAFSTPTSESGQIHGGYLHGSRHQYFVPCPLCGEMQVLAWDGFKFGHCKDLAGYYDKDRVEMDTYYECKACGGRIDEKHKRAMVEGGEWRPTNYREVEGALPGMERVPAWGRARMSARLPEWYGFHSDSTWGKLAVRWIDAQANAGKLHAFWNSVRAEPFAHRAAQITDDLILRLRGDYERGSLPWVPCMGGMAVDVQGDVLKWVMAGFLHNGTMAVSDWGQTLSIDELEDVAARGMLCPDGRVIEPQRVQIDEGHVALEVRKFCRGLFPRFYPSKGTGGIHVRDVTAFRPHKVDQGGLVMIDVCHYSDDAFKHELYIRLIRDFDARKAEAFNSARLWLPKHLDKAFMRELQGERLEKREMKSRPGRIGWEWVQSPPNDYGDCCKMLRVLWSLVSEQFEKRPPVKEVAVA